MADTCTPVAAPRPQYINLDLVRHVLQHRLLSGASRWILFTIASHADARQRQCFCSLDTLARESGWSRRSVMQHIARLLQQGYLRLTGMHRSGTCIYQVQLERLLAAGTPAPHATPTPAAPQQQPVAPPPVPQLPGAEVACPPCENCPAPVQDLPAPGANIAPEEGIEQGLEQQGEEEGARDTPAATVRPSVFEIARQALPQPRQPQQPPSPADATPATPAALATPAAAAISADTIGLLNAQRQRNGKDPLCHRDIVQIGTEAAQAGITPLQAAQWILAKPQRNFFRASFYTPPATPAPPSAAAAATRATAQQQDPPAPPAPPTPEELAAQARDREAGLAHIRACLAKMPVPSAQPIATPRPGATPNVRWAQQTLELLAAGQPVSRYRLHSACEVLGIHPRTLHPAAAQVGANS